MIRLFGVELSWPVAGKLAVAVLAVVAGTACVAVLLQRALAAWARRRGIAPEDTAMPAVHRYLLPVLLVATLQATLSALALPRNLHLVVTRIVSAATLALALYLTSQIILALLGRVARRTEAGHPASTDLLSLTRLGLFVVSGAILLDNLGVRVTALVTTLGVGSLAVALALQDTLGNFFAGIYLQADRPLRVGDYIRLDSGQEGTVVQMGWRSTQLRTLAQNTVVVPNERLSKAVITNYSLPDARVPFTLGVTVSYGADVARVESLLLEAVARARESATGLLLEPRPSVRLIPGFAPAGLQLSLTAWVGGFAEQYAAQDAIRRHILEGFRAAGIEIVRGLDTSATPG